MKIKLVLILCLISILSESQIINTIAGGGSIASNIQATTAVLNQPSGIVMDAGGNIYFSDPAFSVIRKINGSGIITTFAGTSLLGYSGDGGPAINAKLNGPLGMVRDNLGNTYFSDSPENVIRKISPTGIITTFAGTGVAGYNGDGISALSAQLNFPQGLAIDIAQNIYVCDNLNNRIRKITPGGIITTVAGSGGTGLFSGDGGPATSAKLYEPFGVYVSNNNDIYIADSKNFRMRKVDNVTGNISTILGTGLPFISGDGGNALLANGGPIDIKMDASGNIFFSDYFGEIRKINLAGTVSKVAGTLFSGFSGDGGPATSAQLNFPRGLIVKSNGTIIFCDGFNNRVRKIDTLGIITTIAGTTPPVYTYPTNQLIQPSCVAINRFTGNVFFSDYYGYQIRKIDLSSGLMNTIAGNGIRGYNGDGIQATTAQLDTVLGVFSDTSGTYICDAGNSRIRKVDKYGVISTIAGTGIIGFSGDGGLASNAKINFPVDVTIFNNQLYFLDNANARVRKIDLATGTITTIAGNGTGGYTGDNGPATSAGIGSCSSITHDLLGNIYISQYSHHVIRKISAGGIITTYAGNGIAGFFGDNGPANLAQINGPFGLCSDNLGNIYFADILNYRIRKINGAGTITTYACNGIAGFSGDGGSAINAQVGQISSLDVDANSNSLLLADGGNNRVRLISNLATPDICLVSADSTSSYNEIGWDKTSYFNVDSFIVYRETQSSPSIYTKIGAVKSSALSQFNDTNRVYFTNNTLPNGDPNVSTYRYKIKIRDLQNNFSDYSKFHNSVYFKFNTGSFQWNNYLIEPATNPVTGYNLLRDDNSTGVWHIVGSTSGTQNTLVDPAYLSFPNGNWRVDALGFSCNISQRLTNDNSNILVQKTKTKSNNANDKTAIGIKENTSLIKNLKVYPNPANDVLNVELEMLNTSGTNIQLLNPLGQILIDEKVSSQHLTFNIQHLTSGIYFLNIKQNNKIVAVKKVVVE